MPTPETIDLPERQNADNSAGSTSHSSRWPGSRQGLAGLTLFTIILCLCFAKPLSTFVGFALHSDLYSHTILIPFISGYLIWLKRPALRLNSAPSWRAAAFSFGMGLAVLAAYGVSLRTGWKPQPYDKLALMILSFLCFLLCGGFIFLGAAVLRQLAFPVAFLIFMVPFPDVVQRAIETFLQHSSAWVAYLFIKLSGTPVLKQGMGLQLPGFALEVAPECSGIHSSLVLFITSLLAGHLLLRTPLTRTLLVIAIIPLAIARNGFRIFTLAQLCLQVSPDMINSALHHRGGPVFFVLSLMPFFLLLWLLRKLEARRLPKTGP